MSESTTSFGDVLRQLRSAAALSQEELAERAGLSQRGISDLERGVRRVPRLETVRMLASALALRDVDRAALLAAARPAFLGSMRVATPPASPRSVPAQLTHLIGRETELATLRTWVRDEAVRLLTLTGPGGVGKTRLAIAMAIEINDEFRDGVVFVPLAAVTDPAVVLLTMAQAFDVRETRERSLVDALIITLEDRHLLLVLDNFEHVLPAAADLARILEGCPRLTALVTSRAPLRLSGERRFLTLPLALPAPSPTPAIDALAGFAAIALFIERARSVQQNFELNAANAKDIVEICRRLDGLPLAIELAAAWVHILPPAELLGRLEHRLPLLRGGATDQPVRLQTMRNAIAWSYDLLGEHEARLFRRLAVFVGGFTIDAVDWIWEAEEPSTSHGSRGGSADPLDVLSGLIDKSLVQPTQSDGSAPRFIMLETVREFGLERLSGSGKEAAVRAAHAAYFLALAEQASALLRGAEAPGETAALEREHDNLRTALAWFEACGESETLLRLAAALGYFWSIIGHWTEGHAQLERALAAEPQPSDARLEALEHLGEIAAYQGDVGRAEVAMQEGLNLARHLGVRAKISSMLLALGAWLVDEGRYEEGEGYITESIAEARRAGDRYNETLALTHLGIVTWGRGNPAEATTCLETARALAWESRLPMPAAVATRYLGLIATEGGDYARAAEQHRVHAFGYTMHHLVRALPDVASLAAARGEAQQAARLFGAAAALTAAIGFAPAWPERGTHERAVARARELFGDVAFDTAFDAGRHLPREHVVAEIDAVLDAAAPDTRVAGGHGALMSE